jgi:hypothetical protein
VVSEVTIIKKQFSAIFIDKWVALVAHRVSI